MFFLLLLAFGGIYGGIIFLKDPSGTFDVTLPPEFRALPVLDYTPPGSSC